jgi:formylglycine-generating enzyme required for sulfatase activity
MAQKPIEVFFSYSHEDRELRDKLAIHLKGLERQRVISSWHDRQLVAGDKWQKEIDYHTQTADIILLLISPHFIASDYCYEIELPAAMARHKAGEACVIPILLCPVSGWKEYSFAELQVYPNGGKPITSWTHQNDAFVDITDGIRAAVKKLLGERQQQEQELIRWLESEELPLGSEAQVEAQRLLKLAGLAEAELGERMAGIVEARSQAAQQAAQEAEAKRQAAEEAERQAEIERQARLQAEQAEQARRQAEAKRQAQLAAEQAQREKEARERHRSFTINISDRVPLDMIAIPGGKFWMGSPDGVGNDSERPRHEVTIAPFFMGKCPITQAQYQAVTGKNPSHFKGENRPVEKVSWHEAIAFCQQLSKMSDRSFRLPSEAEWEYACRSGTETKFYFGETISAEQVNHSNSNGTSEVGKFQSNSFGLYDMHGNVWEWCADHWHKNYKGAPIDGSAWIKNADKDFRLLRGGSWYNRPGYCRSAYRHHYSPDRQLSSFGFRVVCV